jgi:thymidylate kinase
LAFIVLEGFSGTGKTSLAMGLEGKGWLRLQESAHALPKEVPVADRADTAADFSLLGATMTYSSIISKLRQSRNIVSEGYLLSDLTYARIRYELNKSTAYPAMMAMVKRILEEPAMRPDLYILLRADEATIEQRQRVKDDRERILVEFFQTRYYSALAEIHREVNENTIEEVETDANIEVTLDKILGVLGRHVVIAP